jgi:hypothetical protein
MHLTRRIRSSGHITVAVLIALLVWMGPARAQDRSAIDVGIGLAIGIPQGDFKINVPELGWGGEGHFGVRLGGPLIIGGDLGFMIYGSERRKEPFSLTIPDVTVDVITSNNIFLGHFLMRLQPETGSVRPYIDGLVGFKYFWTETRIEDENDPTEPIASSTNLEDMAFSYGAGFGVAIQLVDGTEKRRETGEGPLGIYLDLRVRYLIGSEADYLKKGSIQRVGTQLIYDVQRSKTDFLVPHIGVSVVF